ncbi:MAG: efflux RND transporter periplasmic adaptor subunit [Lentimicrobiaceae bacterium]|jgi:cobalt-zinc-cadmium efflux system membrane fusion protein|nr:efflux RND transporter periplasmic adaptor subunit [Lentimicrobiaceae bacterium]
MKTYFFNILIIAAFILSFSSCKNSTEKEEKHAEHEELPANIVEMNEEQYATAGIQLGLAEERSLSNLLKVNGNINVTPQSLATVSAPLGGFIKNTNLIQGSLVTKGQTLALIENIEFVNLQQSYLETKAKFSYITYEYERQKDLYKENVSSAKNFQQTESEYKTIKTQLNAYQQKLSMLGIDASKLREDNIKNAISICSPINGYIKNVNVNIGKFVNPSDILFEIVNTQNLTLELIVFEKDVQKISNGQKLSFFTPGKPDIRHEAIIYQVGKALDDDKTVTVYASINQPSKDLIAGMYVNAEIEVKNNQALALPSETIVQFDEKFYVFAFKGKRIENGKQINDFEVIEVKKGMENNGFTEVILPQGFDYKNRKIAIKGAYSLLSKLKNSGEMSC